MTEVLQEKDPKEITELGELQEQARFNTRHINQDRHKLEVIEEGPEKVEISLDLSKRRIRSGALLRRRNEIDRQEKKKKETEELKSYRESVEDLKLSELESIRERIKGELLDLAEKAEIAQRKADSPDQRMLATKLLALSRGCYAAFEAIKRVPKLENENEYYIR